jgi:hypothetical protein
LVAQEIQRSALVLDEIAANTVPFNHILDVSFEVVQAR